MIIVIIIRGLKIVFCIIENMNLKKKKDYNYLINITIIYFLRRKESVRLEKIEQKVIK